MRRGIQELCIGMGFLVRMVLGDKLEKAPAQKQTKRLKTKQNTLFGSVASCMAATSAC